MHICPVLPLPCFCESGMERRDAESQCLMRLARCWPFCGCSVDRKCCLGRGQERAHLVCFSEEKHAELGVLSELGDHEQEWKDGT